MKLASVPLVCLLALASTGRAATPVEEALRLVPEDVGFCLVVQDLREHAARLVTSPFAARLATSPVAVVLRASSESAKIEDAGRALRQLLGRSLEQLRDEVFGDAVVFAYRPGPPGKPEGEQGLFVVRARSETALADLVERINALQKASGDVKELETRRHAGRDYVRRRERERESFYYLRGPLLAFSSQEALLREALERDAADGSESPAVLRQLRGLGAEGHLLALWVNPRAFDAELAAKANASRGDDAAVHALVRRYWSGLDGLALSLDTHEILEVKLAIRARREEWPRSAQRLLATAAHPSDLWRRFPADAVLAGAVRIDFAALAEVVAELQPPTARQAGRDGLQRTLGAVLGRDVFTEILPHLGPDVGFYVAPPTTGADGPVPRAVVALPVQPGTGTPPVDRSLFGALQSLAMIGVLAYNREHADLLTLRTEPMDGPEVKYLESARLPPGFRPAAGLHGGCLVVATSPAVLRQLVERPTPDIGRGTEVPLMTASSEVLCRYLAEHRAALTTLLAAQHGLTAEEVGRRLEAVRAALALVNGVHLSHRSHGGNTTQLVLRINPAAPLRASTNRHSR